MKIYIRHLDGDKEVIRKYRIPIGLFLNSFTAKIAASAITGNFRKEIIKALEGLKDNSALQSADKCPQHEVLIPSAENDDLVISSELSSSFKGPNKELPTEELPNVFKNIDVEKSDNTSISDNKIDFEQADLNRDKYTINFADGTTIEREISEVDQNKNTKSSYIKPKPQVLQVNNELIWSDQKVQKQYSLFSSSGKDLAIYADKINKLKTDNDKEFNRALSKYRKLYKRQKQSEFKQIFKVLKKSARQNKGLRLVDVQSRDGTIVIIEF